MSEKEVGWPESQNKKQKQNKGMTDYSCISIAVIKKMLVLTCSLSSGES